MLLSTIDLQLILRVLLIAAGVFQVSAVWGQHRSAAAESQGRLTETSIRLPTCFVIFWSPFGQSGHSHGDKCGLSHPSWLGVPFSWRRERNACIPQMCIWRLCLCFFVCPESQKSESHWCWCIAKREIDKNRKRVGEHPDINLVSFVTCPKFCCGPDHLGNLKVKLKKSEIHGFPKTAGGGWC